MPGLKNPRARFVRYRPYVEFVVALALFLGFARYYLIAEARVSSLSFFFLPVTTTAVVFGRIRGAIVAAVCVLLALAPLFSRGLGYIDAAGGVADEPAVSFFAWAVILMGTAYVVGFVSEVGGTAR